MVRNGVQKNGVQKNGIRNERQYRVTKAQARHFEQALAHLDAAPEPAVGGKEHCVEDGAVVDPQVHPLLRRAEEEALRSQLSELRSQLAEYEARALRA